MDLDGGRGGGGGGGGGDGEEAGKGGEWREEAEGVDGFGLGDAVEGGGVDGVGHFGGGNLEIGGMGVSARVYDNREGTRHNTARSCGRGKSR